MVVRGTTVLLTLVQPIATGTILLIVTTILGFVSRVLSMPESKVVILWRVHFKVHCLFALIGVFLAIRINLLIAIMFKITFKMGSRSK